MVNQLPQSCHHFCHLIKMNKTIAPSEFSWQEFILMALTPGAVSMSKFASNFNRDVNSGSIVHRAT